MFFALLGCNQTSLEILFKLYLEHIDKIYLYYVHLKASFFSQKCFTWPLEARIP